MLTIAQRETRVRELCEIARLAPKDFKRNDFVRVKQLCNGALVTRSGFDDAVSQLLSEGFTRRGGGGLNAPIDTIMGDSTLKTSALETSEIHESKFEKSVVTRSHRVKTLEQLIESCRNFQTFRTDYSESCPFASRTLLASLLNFD